MANVRVNAQQPEPGEAISQRALNRATLARQHLLQRTRMPALTAIEHLVGMQAQVPRTPYVGLWSRLEGFEAAELSEAMASRQAVRAPLMRATIHMTSARDARELWPLVQPVLERNLMTGSPFGRNLKQIDMEVLLAAGKELIDEAPRSTAELKALLGERWPETDGTSMAYAVNHLLPVVQVTPRGLWTESSQTRWTTFDTWMGQSINAEPSREMLVLRYLAAFGPASVADIQNWSGLTRLKDVFAALLPQLWTFRNEQGKELFDLPEAPRPDPSTPAPVRFLPVYDNVLLGHADRCRFFSADTVIPAGAGGARDVGTILVDGFVRGIWLITRVKQAATLSIQTFQGLAAADVSAIHEEGSRLLDFVAADAASREVAFVTL